jgi:phage/plasmid-like protein (TIGR03299 family)
MAHQISEVSGRAEIAYAGETPWHGLGVKVDGLQTAADMLRHAGLEWGVGLQQVCRQDGRPVDGFRFTVREDCDVVLGVVTEHYQLIQSTQAAEVMDALVTEGGAHAEVAGALEAGQRCWMLAHIPADFEVAAGDEVRPYILMAWGHDGKHGLAAKLTPIRVVCNNTLTAALGRKWSSTADVYVRHHRNASVRIEEARRAMGLIRKKVAATQAVYTQLASTAIDATAYFSRVFQAPERTPGVGDDKYDEKLARWTAHQQRLPELYASGQGSDLPGERGTAWAAYNSVTEWGRSPLPAAAIRQGVRGANGVGAVRPLRQVNCAKCSQPIALTRCYRVAQRPSVAR